jgi:membrane-associated protein
MDLIAMVDPMMASAWLYPAVFALTTLDAVVPVIPSEAIVLAAGVFAAGSGAAPSLPLVIAAAAAGVWAGDHLAYFVGRSVLGNKLVMRSGRLRKAVGLAAKQLDRRGGGLIVTSRFIPGGRITMNLVSGMTRFPLARFTRASALGAVGWATYTVALGFIGGTAFAANPLLGLALGFGLSIGITALIEHVRRRRSQRVAAAATAEPAASEPGAPDAAVAPPGESPRELVYAG